MELVTGYFLPMILSSSRASVSISLARQASSTDEIPVFVRLGELFLPDMAIKGSGDSASTARLSEGREYDPPMLQIDRRYGTGAGEQGWPPNGYYPRLPQICLCQRSSEARAVITYPELQLGHRPLGCRPPFDATLPPPLVTQPDTMASGSLSEIRSSHP